MGTRKWHSVVAITSLFDLWVKKSYMIGDKILDVDAGQRIGVRTILIPEAHMRDEFLSKK